MTTAAKKITVQWVSITITLLVIFASAVRIVTAQGAKLQQVEGEVISMKEKAGECDRINSNEHREIMQSLTELKTMLKEREKFEDRGYRTRSNQ